MNVNLSPQAEKQIQDLVASGRYSAPADVIQAALDVLLAVEVLTKNVRPAPNGAPEKPSEPKQPIDLYGFMKGTIKVTGDIINLPEDVWRGYE
jgi:hypothetical protein